jgi:hypothetical protein
MWAFIVGAKAAVSLWLLGTVSATTYATVKSVVAPTSAVLGAAITVVISAHAARHEGLLPSRRTAPALA